MNFEFPITELPAVMRGPRVERRRVLAGGSFGDVRDQAHLHRTVGPHGLETRQRLGVAPDAPAEEVQKALLDIADLLDGVSFDLENGVYPHGKCAEMEMLSINLSDALTGDISDDYLEVLKNILNSAVEIE